MLCSGAGAGCVQVTRYVVTLTLPRGDGTDEALCSCETRSKTLLHTARIVCVRWEFTLRNCVWRCSANICQTIAEIVRSRSAQPDRTAAGHTSAYIRISILPLMLAEDAKLPILRFVCAAATAHASCKLTVHTKVLEAQDHNTHNTHRRNRRFGATHTRTHIHNYSHARTSTQ